MSFAVQMYVRGLVCMCVCVYTPVCSCPWMITQKETKEDIKTCTNLYQNYSTTNTTFDKDH